MKEFEKPEVEHHTDSPIADMTYRHPAYGTITMTVVSGSVGGSLFGSDLEHDQAVRITINKAVMNRGLSRDWIHGREHLVEFEMSHAQFAQFITSNGRGEGTPITLRYARTGEYENIPGILKDATKHEVLKKEVESAAMGRLEKAMERECGAVQIAGFDPAIALGRLRNELDWVRREFSWRSEYYCSNNGKPYTYGRGKGVRTYQSQPWHDLIREMWAIAQEHSKCSFDVCFLNLYEDQNDALGWHADDSPEMDDSRPIAIISLGAEREIWFRENPEPRTIRSVDQNQEVEKLKLESGSLCLMLPGMQDTHQHRIPSAGFECGPRISLTFRGYVNP